MARRLIHAGVALQAWAPWERGREVPVVVSGKAAKAKLGRRLFFFLEGISQFSHASGGRRTVWSCTTPPLSRSRGPLLAGLPAVCCTRGSRILDNHKRADPPDGRRLELSRASAAPVCIVHFYFEPAGSLPPPPAPSSLSIPLRQPSPLAASLQDGPACHGTCSAPGLGCGYYGSKKLRYGAAC